MNNVKLLEDLRHFSGTESYHRNFLGILYTDGIQYLASQAECYWLIDLVASYQCDMRVKDSSFQIYELTVNRDKTAIVKIMDRDNKVLAKQWIDYTTFPLEKMTMMFQDNVLFLPNEY